METILINTESAEQSNLIKELLREMRIRFTSYTDKEPIEVSAAELEAIDKGLEDVANHNVMSHEEAKKVFHDAIYQVEQ